MGYLLTLIKPIYLQCDFKNLFSLLWKYHYHITKVSQKFCNILVMWGTIQHLYKLLQRPWKWRVNSELWDAKLTSYTLNGTCQILLYGLKLDLRINAFRLTRPCMFINVLATWAKFLKPFGYCTVINCTFTFHVTNQFCCFQIVMTLCEFVN